MTNLQDIISSNIEWFWKNDPMLEHGATITELWNGFKLWCVQNCKEVTKLEEDFIEKEVDKSYSNWMKFKEEN